MTWSIHKAIKRLPYKTMSELLYGMLILSILSVILLFIHNTQVLPKSKFEMKDAPFEPYTLSPKISHNPQAYWDEGPSAVTKTMQRNTEDRYTLVEVPLRVDPPRDSPLQAQVELITPYNCPYYKR